MSKQAVEQILGRIITDAEFRRLFFEDAQAALKGYDLSDEEREALLKTQVEDIESFSRKLDERITKGKLIH